jgi:hypothetical protein
MPVEEDLFEIESIIKDLDPDGDRFSKVIRATIDQLLDGRTTGRWDYDQLFKTEKTHMGTLIEINLQREFLFDDGDVTDYKISGLDVDCKFSQRVGGWEFGPEMINQYCLVVWASDLKSQWSVGLVFISNQMLRTSVNRDAKRRLAEEGVQQIHWLWQFEQLEPNQLLHLPANSRERIMEARSLNRNVLGIQARVNQLFREVQGEIIRRTTLETVAFGAKDPLKRVRVNGGARGYLQNEGIIILGHQENEPLVARSLGLPIPKKGEFIAVRLVKINEAYRGRNSAEINGHLYAVAKPDDPVEEAPIIPKLTR